METNSILNLMQNKTITPKNVLIKHLGMACNWLEQYEFNGELTKGELETAQALANVIAFLDKEISRRSKGNK
jgi:hypothetical protein